MTCCGMFGNKNKPSISYWKSKYILKLHSEKNSSFIDNVWKAGMIDRLIVLWQRKMAEVFFKNWEL